MVHMWFPRKKWRTAAWHIKDKKFEQDGYLFIQYQPSYDAIGAETGRGHLMIWERWPSFSHGIPGEDMTEREALKFIEQVEADCDREYKRVNDRHYDSYRALGEEYFNAKPFREHPLLISDSAVTLDKDAKTMRPLKFNAAAGRGGNAGRAPAPQRIIDDRSWRTAAFYVETHGYPRPVKYTTFCEIRPHPDVEKEQQGLYQFVTWRMGENSVYCQKDDEGIHRCLERISYFEYEHKECKPASPAETGPLALPAEYFRAAEYHAHPHFHPEDVTVGRQVRTLKALKFKPKQ
jgi:hypothetical protein